MAQECPNCGQLIEYNYDMHVIFCTRNCIRCPKCSDVIRKEEFDEHNLTVHKEIQCEKCGKLIDSYFMEQHELEECERRIVGKCPYCQLELISENQKQHIQECGSRTDLCEICGERVMLSDMEAHIESNCKGFLTKNVAEKSQEDRKTDGYRPSPAEIHLDNLRAISHQDFFGMAPDGHIYDPSTGNTDAIPPSPSDLSASFMSALMQSSQPTYPESSSDDSSLIFLCPICCKASYSSAYQTVKHMEGDCPMKEMRAEIQALQQGKKLLPILFMLDEKGERSMIPLEVEEVEKLIEDEKQEEKIKKFGSSSTKPKTQPSISDSTRRREKEREARPSALKSDARLKEAENLENSMSMKSKALEWGLSTMALREGIAAEKMFFGDSELDTSKGSDSDPFASSLLTPPNNPSSHAQQPPAQQNQPFQPFQPYPDVPDYSDGSHERSREEQLVFNSQRSIDDQDSAIAEMSGIDAEELRRQKELIQHYERMKKLKEQRHKLITSSSSSSSLSSLSSSKERNRSHYESQYKKTDFASHSKASIQQSKNLPSHSPFSSYPSPDPSKPAGSFATAPPTFSSRASSFNAGSHSSAVHPQPSEPSQITRKYDAYAEHRISIREDRESQGAQSSRAPIYSPKQMIHSVHQAKSPPTRVELPQPRNNHITGQRSHTDAYAPATSSTSSFPYSSSSSSSSSLASSSISSYLNIVNHVSTANPPGQYQAKQPQTRLQPPPLPSYVKPYLPNQSTSKAASSGASRSVSLNRPSYNHGRFGNRSSIGSSRQSSDIHSSSSSFSTSSSSSSSSASRTTPRKTSSSSSFTSSSSYSHPNSTDDYLGMRPRTCASKAQQLPQKTPYKSLSSYGLTNKPRKEWR
ncbi:uncharacterized protein MONOS_11066 [Monocercomonoides exilis]|uniref:uncharacterized protein n=1 Tax=Monocercomonoides exilis TaxID=2049356 RepID=UPI00355999A1|nr:hypothetical protein MONOS_11066 [Monocercomonoides exilis]|eukprot:MONOS_11066.1-p1 / transcript=MONOS_11066.1 / gene=MONOS_11066 / organism=Monocercomonoides_exilis_PA203 / gene_product=unspecified product / transcript_product=unspecified product / location=Mono_scaffold00534:14738-17979(-) / protein_length=865 / sequence_SO=supercontig / SO=protein_coding / is_pseudo=false